MGILNDAHPWCNEVKEIIHAMDILYYEEEA